MAEFNYSEYIKNNPLLTVVEEKLLTESLEVNETEEVTEEKPSSKTTVSALKNEIKEMILASMNEGEDGHVGGNTDADFEREAAMQMSMREEEEDEDIEAEMDEDPEMEAEPAMDAVSSGMTPEEEQVQDSLQQALAAAQAMGDEKLVDQIGNSITFFTRTHVVER